MYPWGGNKGIHTVASGEDFRFRMEFINGYNVALTNFNITFGINTTGSAQIGSVTSSFGPAECTVSGSTLLVSVSGALEGLYQIVVTPRTQGTGRGTLQLTVVGEASATLPNNNPAQVIVQTRILPTVTVPVSPGDRRHSHEGARQAIGGVTQECSIIIR